jgi:hypothetical protein
MAITKKVSVHYPNAKSGDDITESYLTLLEKEYNSDLRKMLFATSVCSDDVNVSTDFRRVLSRPFTMGGLGGLPYSGFTGMVAFSHIFLMAVMLLFFMVAYWNHRRGRIRTNASYWTKTIDQ